MISIQSATYAALAAKLTEKIGNNNYYNGTTEADFENVHAQFKATFVIYRPKDAALCPSDQTTISDIVPVWWQFDTVLPEGNVANDFDWHKLKSYILQ